ncbi:MAG TPA: hypothetical protein VIM93_12185 [Kangiella sp.]
METVLSLMGAPINYYDAGVGATIPRINEMGEIMSYEQLGTGIVAGIISATILGLALYLIKSAWKAKIEPWWENKLYGDARIDGEWKSELHATETEPDIEEVTIRQTGHKVEGDISCTSGPDSGRKYRFTGCIKNQILSGYYWNIDKTSIDSGSFSLRLEQDGCVLVGHTVYYNDQKHSLLSRQYTWTRNRMPVGQSTIEKPNETGRRPQQDAQQDVSGAV